MVVPKKIRKKILELIIILRFRGPIRLNKSYIGSVLNYSSAWRVTVGHNPDPNPNSTEEL